MDLGTTFDLEQAEKFGLEWRNALRQLIKLRLSPVRIGVKWARVITQKTEQNWREYDEIFDKLNKHDTPTILQLGMKSPQWPEVYIPKWIEETENIRGEITTDNKCLKENLFDFMIKTLRRYKDLKNIKWIQVENEPFLKIPPTQIRISETFLREEVAHVKGQTKLPIILTAQGLPTTGIIAEYLKGRFNYKKELLRNSDTLGLNVFPKIRGRIFGSKEIIFQANNLAWQYLSKWLNRAKKMGRKLWVTELQAEPWGPQKLDLKDPYSDTTCNPMLVKQYLEKLKLLGFETVLIWGSEFHLACENAGNREWIEEVYNET